MKKILLILFSLTLFSCHKGDVEGMKVYKSMDVTKFEFEGNHYIQFILANGGGGAGVTLDPDYMFKCDTIVYGGNKYVKLNQ